MKGFHAAVRALIILLVCSALFPIIRERALSSNPISLSTEPNALPPLTDLNSSVYGLEVPATPSAVGDNFTVEIHLRNATVTNVATGIAGVETHLYFGNILTYAEPTGFVNKVGQPGGVLTGPGLIYGIGPGFFDAGGQLVSSPPYVGAVYFEVGAASSTPWNGADGLVANITFRIIKQPQGSLGEPTVALSLSNDFTDIETNVIVDPYSNATMPESVPHESTPGSLILDSNYVPPANYSLTVQESPASSGTVHVKVGGVDQTRPYAFSNGTVAQLTATSSAGYNFSSWTLDGADVGAANPYSIIMNSNHSITANFAPSFPAPNPLPVTLTAEPFAVPPLVDINSSLYGLETPPTQVVVGEEFKIELHLRNATQINVPLGIGSIEVHFRFGEIRNYLQPVGFVNRLGAPDGVLNPDIQFAISPGFHDIQGNGTVPAEAVSYDVAAHSTGSGWNGIDGLVATIAFEILNQPQASLGETNLGFQMDYTFTNLTDFNGNKVFHDRLNATITLDSVLHDVAVTNVTLSKTVVGEGYPVSIGVTVANLGSVSEDFLLTVYANASVVDSQIISLASVNSSTVNFVRNTTGFARGHYIIEAVAEAVLGEANTADNTYLGGLVTVTIPGDIDGNGKVQLVDLVRLAIAFGRELGQPNWNPNADIDCNGVVDHVDLSMLAQDYGQRFP
jgi:copper(I)-binding protein